MAIPKQPYPFNYKNLCVWDSVYFNGMCLKVEGNMQEYPTTHVQVGCRPGFVSVTFIKKWSIVNVFKCKRLGVQYWQHFILSYLITDLNWELAREVCNKHNTQSRSL